MNSLLFGSLHPDEFNNLFKPLPDDNLTARTGCFERERERERAAERMAKSTPNEQDSTVIQSFKVHRY